MAYSKQNFQNGQTLDAANLETMENGIIAGQGVKNLLINSNFKDPINSSGKTSWSVSGFTIDKWRADSTATVSLTSSGITIDATSVAGNFQQNIDNLPNGTYTFAALVNNVIRTIAFTNNNGTITTVDNSNASFGGSGSISAGKGSSAYYVQINNLQGHTNTIAWAALYEGSYTAETLPGYVPKDKYIEMLNCGVSLVPHNLLDNSDFSNPVNSRGKNTYSDEGNEYTIDKWKTGYKTNISIENGYINIFGHWRLEQYIQNPKDGIYTFAARIRINSIGRGRPVIYVDDNSGPSNDLSLDANIGEWKTYILQHDFSSATGETITFALSPRGGDTTASISVEWAAMYKGAYTADTLPPYVPKGKHVEMLNCNVPLAPHNFLDNSDFSDPVNQLGLTSFTPIGKNLDRWEANLSNKATITIGNGKITISKSETGGNFTQTIPVDLTGKMMTYAVKTANGIICKSAIISSSPSPAQIDGMNAYLRVYVSGGKTFFQIYFNTTDSITLDLYWAALYEGSYTADTLPPYVPKDKRVEMLSCGVQLNPKNLLDNSDFLNPVNQRGKTSYTNNGYTIDRWKDASNTTTIITGIGLTLQNDSTTSNAYWRQRVPAKILTSGKTYTMAINVSGNIFCGTAIIDTSNSVTFYGANGLYLACTGYTSPLYWTIQIAVSPGKSFSGVSWVALYEGAYTVDTLPTYQPKGYTAELIECQRYYRTMSYPVIPCANNPAGKQVYGFLPFRMRIDSSSVYGNSLYYFKGDTTFYSVTTMSATSYGAGTRITFNLSQDVEGNLAGAVAGNKITFDADL